METQGYTSLSPGFALAAFLVPMLALLPFKLGGLWLIGKGHALLGLATFLTAKFVGTALFAWLFSLTKPALLQIAWFARVNGIVLWISEIAHEWIDRQPLYQWLRSTAKKLRSAVKNAFASW